MEPKVSRERQLPLRWQRHLPLEIHPTTCKGKGRVNYESGPRDKSRRKGWTAEGGKADVGLLEGAASGCSIDD
jgi:hypothetical protein